LPEIQKVHSFFSEEQPEVCNSTYDTNCHFWGQSQLLGKQKINFEKMVLFLWN